MEEGEAKAKKTEASMFSGREEVIDRGLFGEGVDTATGPEDTITKVAKTKAYTGQLAAIGTKWIEHDTLCYAMQQVNRSLTRVRLGGSRPK